MRTHCLPFPLHLLNPVHLHDPVRFTAFLHSSGCGFEVVVNGVTVVVGGIAVVVGGILVVVGGILEVVGGVVGVVGGFVVVVGGIVVVAGGMLVVVACVFSGNFFVGLVTFCVKPRLFLSLHLISSFISSS